MRGSVNMGLTFCKSTEQMVSSSFSSSLTIGYRIMGREVGKGLLG